jgi:hypothetical protein
MVIGALYSQLHLWRLTAQLQTRLGCGLVPEQDYGNAPFG